MYVHAVAFTLSCSDCYRLEQPVAGWELHSLKIHALLRRTEQSRLKRHVR